MFDRSLYEELGGFDESLDFLEDWDLWVRYSTKTDFKFIDRNRMGNHGYPSEWFVDDDHLCIEGAKSFTATVDLILNGLE